MRARGQWALFLWPWSLSSASSPPDPAPNLLSQQLYPFLSTGNWHGLDGHCSGAASLSSWFKKSPACPWSPPPPKWLFFLVATEKIPYCKECPTHQTFCRALSQWSSAGKCSLVQSEGAVSQGMAQHSQRGSSSRAQPVWDTSASPALLHCSSSWGLGAEAAACAILHLCLHLTKALGDALISHFSPAQ